jgi:hypothetical protein
MYLMPNARQADKARNRTGEGFGHSRGSRFAFVPQARCDLAPSTPTRRLRLRFATSGFAPPRFKSLPAAFCNENTPHGDVFDKKCAGQDSNLRRLMPLDLQSNAIDHSATDAIILLCVLARYLNIK